jgi:DHA2 family multidrug resistance protein-like MFS transporter
MSALGLCLMAAALAAMALLLPSQPPLAALAFAMALGGIGFGLFQAPNNHVMLTTGPIDRAGAAAGMLSLCRLLGQTAGALIAALCLSGPGGLAVLYIAVVLALGGAFWACRR